MNFPDARRDFSFFKKASDFKRGHISLFVSKYFLINVTPAAKLHFYISVYHSVQRMTGLFENQKTKIGGIFICDLYTVVFKNTFNFGTLQSSDFTEKGKNMFDFLSSKAANRLRGYFKRFSCAICEYAVYRVFENSWKKLWVDRTYRSEWCLPKNMGSES